MKRMPMFLMMLLATAMADGSSVDVVPRDEKNKAVEGDLTAENSDTAFEALGEAERVSARASKNAA